MDIIFRSLLTLSPRTDLSIVNKFNIRYFLKEICINFTLDNVLRFSLSFLQSLLFYFLASLMAFSGIWKCRDCKFVEITSPYSSLWLTSFPIAKISKAWRFLLYMDNHFPLQWKLVRTKETTFLSTLLIGSFTRYKHLPTSGFQIII